MPLSVDELLKPRYKVIAGYPGSVQAVGYIHEVIGDTSSVIYWCMEKDKYPHLFQKLEWWEERTEDEMPEYVKLNPENTTGGNEVFKVLEVKMYVDGIGLKIKTKYDNLIPDECIPFEQFTSAKYFKPATREDYDLYQSTVK